MNILEIKYNKIKANWTNLQQNSLTGNQGGRNEQTEMCEEKDAKHSDRI